MVFFIIEFKYFRYLYIYYETFTLLKLFSFKKNKIMLNNYI